MTHTTFDLTTGRNSALNGPVRVISTLGSLLQQSIALAGSALIGLTQENELDRLSEFHLRDIGLERDNHGYPKVGYEDLLARRWPR